MTPFSHCYSLRQLQRRACKTVLVRYRLQLHCPCKAARARRPGTETRCEDRTTWFLGGHARATARRSPSALTLFSASQERRPSHVWIRGRRWKRVQLERDDLTPFYVCVACVCGKQKICISNRMKQREWRDMDKAKVSRRFLLLSKQ